MFNSSGSDGNMGIFLLGVQAGSFRNLIVPSGGIKPRNVFFGGKGGVGKTTCAAAAAVWAADQDYRTLLISGDPTDSLAWVLAQELKPKPTPLKGIKNLHVMALDPKKLIVEQKDAVKQKIQSMVGFTVSGIEDYLEATAISPGIEEEAIFDKFVEYLGCNDYDIVVFDTAPTGYTLRLLSLSKILGKWLNSLIKIRKRAMSMRKLVSKAEIDEDVVLSGLVETRERFRVAREVMTNKERTTFVLVITAELIPILEASHAVGILKTLDMKVGGTVVNCLLGPQVLTHGFFKERKKMQDEYSSLIKEQFAQQVIVTVPLFERDIRGIDMLKRVASCMFAE